VQPLSAPQARRSSSQPPGARGRAARSPGGPPSAVPVQPPGAAPGPARGRAAPGPALAPAQRDPGPRSSSAATSRGTRRGTSSSPRPTHRRPGGRAGGHQAQAPEVERLAKVEQRRCGHQARHQLQPQAHPSATHGPDDPRRGARRPG
jgi:hypothetical protein